MKKVCTAIRNVLICLFGLALIAIGIDLSKKSGLGIASIASIPGVLSKATHISLGSMIIAVYCALIPAQLIVLRKKFRPVNLFGIPAAIVFGLLVDVFGVSEFTPTLAGIPVGFTKTYRGLMMGLPKLRGGYVTRMMYLLLGIVAIGIGMFIYLRPKLVYLPTDGLARAISKVSDKSFHTCRTVMDLSMIAVALILQLILLGGPDSFVGKSAVGVREGTLFSAILIGQVVKGLNKAFPKKKKHKHHHHSHE